MGFLLIILTVALLGFVNLAIVRSFRQRREALSWWGVLVAAWAVGSALGFWSGFFLEYRPSSKLRVAGAPIPVAFFHWEGQPGEERWIDFITPVPLLFAGSNVVVIGLLAACPVGLAYRFFRRPFAPAESAMPEL
jgi:hypothetical protein